RAHIHRQRLGDGTKAARLLGAIDPYLERIRGPILDVPDEYREIAERVPHRIRPTRVPVGQLGTTGPTQARERRLRRLLEANPAIRIRDIEILRCDRLLL